MARPRDPEVDVRILRATRRLLERDGAEHLTMEAIATEAGVGKPAIYRRYASKDEIVMSVSVADSHPPTGTIDTGSFAEDIRAFAAHTRRTLRSMPRAVVGPQIGRAIADEEAGLRFLEQFAHTSAPGLGVIWERGIARGEVDPDLDFLAAKTALGTSLIFSVLLYRYDPDGPEVAQIIDLWIAGVHP